MDPCVLNEHGEMSTTDERSQSTTMTVVKDRYQSDRRLQFPNSPQPCRVESSHVLRM
jgi:hypothetical protein